MKKFQPLLHDFHMLHFRKISKNGITFHIVSTAWFLKSLLCLKLNEMIPYISQYSKTSVHLCASTLIGIFNQINDPYCKLTSVSP